MPQHAHYDYELTVQFFLDSSCKNAPEYTRGLHQGVNDRMYTDSSRISVVLFFLIFDDSRKFPLHSLLVSFSFTPSACEISKNG